MMAELTAIVRFYTGNTTKRVKKQNTGRLLGRNTARPGSSAGEVYHNPVDSSNLEVVSYLPDNEILQIEFKNGSIYRYYKVPFDVWEELNYADSQGKYFWKNIRDFYKYRRMQ